MVVLNLFWVFRANLKNAIQIIKCLKKMYIASIINMQNKYFFGMNELQMVSVIMPYSYARYIEQSIEAVLAQTYSNIEVIIIDDTSTDDSIEIIQQFAANDNRIKVITNHTNQGVVVCRNLGIEKASGMYLCFIDPDDIWDLNKLEIQLQALETSNGNLCFTDIQIIDAVGEKGKIRKHYYHEYSYKSLLKRNFIPHSTLLLKKNFLIIYAMKIFG
jgi:teichuronic acid biosynthesis glycosyltransferase TuaG